MKKLIVLLLTFSAISFAVSTDELVQIHQLSSTQKDALTAPVDGMLVFDTTAKRLYVFANSSWRELLITPKVLTKTANYTLQASDNGEVLTFNSATPVTLTIPSGFPVGYNVSVYQTGTGKVTIVGSGATILNRLNKFRTAGKDAGVCIVSTATDTYHLTGDLRR